MQKDKITYYFLTVVLLMLVASCNLTKNIPKEKFLLKGNKIELNGDKNIEKSELSSIIRQQPNKSLLGVKFKLGFYEMIDSTKVSQKRIQKNQKIHQKNQKKIQRQNRINDKRIEKARKSNSKYYTEKIIPIKDTLKARKFFKEWIKYSLGEPPVIYDSILKGKSVEQLKIYLRRKGFYNGEVSSKIDTISEKKINVTYFIKTGNPTIINNDSLVTNSYEIKNSYNNYKKKRYEEAKASNRKFNKSFEEYKILEGKTFDIEMLENERNQIAKHFRDDLFYGFSPNYITFLADTTINPEKTNIRIVIANRTEKNDSTTEVKELPHRRYYIGNVNFRLSDTTYFKGNFTQKINSDSLEIRFMEFLPTFDSIVYNDILYNKKQKVERNIPKEIDSANINRIATIHFNTKPIVKPGILELQNYLEHGQPYREYYVERTFNSLIQLNTFQVIKPVYKERKDTNLLDVDYYLVPNRKQSFYVEPRFTSSGGFLGLSSSINYTNKNLVRGSEKLTISFSGGLESQPALFDKTLDNQSQPATSRNFNTFEIGPSITLDLPGLYPVNATKLSKRHRPRTIISTAYNLQKRRDFDRNIFQLNYLYKFYSTNRTQVFQIGLPFTTIKYVLIDKSAEFQDRINKTNDLFLKNAYNNQFIMQDIKITYEYSNKNKSDFTNVKARKSIVRFNTSFDHAGGLLNIITRNNAPNENGQRTIFEVPFSQFFRLDNEFVLNKPLLNEKSINLKFAAGLGLPYGNTTTSMPFDYSFFSGGANDNRGWRARALGPGSYSAYLDSNATATQIGDVRLGAFLEYRFSLSSDFKSALFLDVSNVWTTKNDINRPGGQFSKSFYKEFAIALGTGIRLDLDFFVIRVDIGFPIYNPALPESSRWVFNSRKAFIDSAKEYWKENYASKVLKPFTPAIQLGIGYPF